MTPAEEFTRVVTEWNDAEVTRLIAIGMEPGAAAKEAHRRFLRIMGRAARRTSRRRISSANPIDRTTRPSVR